MKNRIIEKLTAIFCALCLAVAVMSGAVLAKDDETPEESSVQTPEATFIVVDASSSEPDAADGEITDNRTSLPCYAGGNFVGTCIVTDGVPFMGVKEFCNAAGLNDISFSDNGQSLTVTAEGLSISCSVGQTVFTCNDRFLYVSSGIPSVDGELYLPVKELVKCFGIAAEWDRSAWRLDILPGTMTPLEDGSSFYNETDVYWLSRLIYATAGGMVQEAQIGVGSVIMNRVADSSFVSQNTVYDVIFAKNQFDAVINGMIYMTPDEDSVTAAKLALESYDTTDGATGFTTGIASADELVTAVWGEISFTTPLEQLS